jgi:TRAP-type C4-dicarboxylate transport system permease small subunit
MLTEWGDPMADEPLTAMQKVQYYTGGALGAGTVLVLVPCVALYFGVARIGESPTVGLPILAIFGIMILFGSLALVATLFARLELSDRSQALALPEGSIRAAIALSLIVLFAIISIMLYQSLSKPYVIDGVEESDRVALVKALANTVIAVVPDCIEKSVSGAPLSIENCQAANLRYAIHVRQPSPQESTDLAKQLLILIGTLMTSVTSFYFASRATEPRLPVDRGAPNAGIAGPARVAGDDGDDGLIDGCDVPITDATPDDELPAAQGGVA